MLRVIRVAAGVVALATLVAGASSAGASPAPSGRYHALRISHDSQVSSNWAGYAVAGADPADGSPVAYTDVTGSWIQPKVTCTPGTESYSAFWIGLGGFSDASQALEQIGTESDCTAGGKAVYAAWYEIIPAPSIPLRIVVRAGDRMTAAVLVQGTQLILQLTNETRHVRVTRRVTMAEPDTSSAEWIAEAPSTCSSSGRCSTLPLANFRSVVFSRSAATGSEHAGTINDSAWNASSIELSEGPSGPLDALTGRSSAGSGGATPSALSADGRAFSVAWHAASG